MPPCKLWKGKYLMMAEVNGCCFCSNIWCLALSSEVSFLFIHPPACTIKFKYNLYIRNNSTDFVNNAKHWYFIFSNQISVLCVVVCKNLNENSDFCTILTIDYMHMIVQWHLKGSLNLEEKWVSCKIHFMYAKLLIT